MARSTTSAPRVEAAHQKLLDGSGTGGDALGWRRLLLQPDDALLEDLATTAEQVRQDAGTSWVIIGIGGSYLGAKAVIEALTPYFPAAGPEILFARQPYQRRGTLRELLAYLEGKSVYVNVISKSGTTLEPALAFRFLREWLESHFDDAEHRIVVTTDPSEGRAQPASERAWL